MHWFLGIFEFDLWCQFYYQRPWLNLLYPYIKFLFYTNLVHGLVNIAIKTSYCFFPIIIRLRKEGGRQFCHILFFSSFKFLLVLWITFSSFISSLWFQLVFRCDFIKVSTLLFIMIVTCLIESYLYKLFKNYILQVENRWPMKTKNQTM